MEIKYKKGSLGWLKERAKKDGFIHIREWQIWKITQNNISKLKKDVQNIEQISTFENKDFNDKEREIFYRFWKHVDIKDNTGECWNWISAERNRFGYGGFNFYGRNTHAHRVAYMLTKGIILEGLEVQHNCNNPKCCNPNHLELGDHSKNMRYKVKCGRLGTYGDNNGHAVLASDDVREIYKIYKEREFTRQEIAEMFDIHPGTLSNIISGRIWRHIYEEEYSRDAKG